MAYRTLLNRFIFPILSLFVISACSSDDEKSEPVPAAPITPKPVTREQLLAGTSYKIWRAVSMKRDGAEVLKECVKDEDVVFHRNGTMETKTTSEPCEGVSNWGEGFWSFNGSSILVINGYQYQIVTLTEVEHKLQWVEDSKTYVLSFKKK